MYIVTRTFRDSNGVFGVGSIVDPTSVKTFRARLQQRHIVDVNESNVQYWADFFKNRYNIDLAAMLESSPAPEPTPDPTPEPESAPVDEGEQETESVPEW